MKSNQSSKIKINQSIKNFINHFWSSSSLPVLEIANMCRIVPLCSSNTNMRIICIDYNALWLDSLCFFTDGDIHFHRIIDADSFSCFAARFKFNLFFGRLEFM